MRVAACTFVLCAALLPLEARRLPIKTYTTADGLARDRIQCIVQDKRGFMWFCTAEGLSRFDGYRFTNYGTEQGLPHSSVTGIVETSDGVYWVSTWGGLSRFDSTAPGGAKLLRYQLPGIGYAQEIRLLFLDRAGAVWAGTNGGLFRLPKSGSAFERVDVDPAAAQCDSTWKPNCGAVGIKALMEDRQGALWVSTRGALYRRERDGRTRLVLPWGPGTMLEDREGRLWFDGSRCRLDGASTRVERVAVLRDESAGLGVLSELQSSTGKIWLGTSRGLAEWIPEAAGTDREFEFYDMSNGLMGRYPHVLTEDRDGNLWIGTEGGGVMKMAPSGLVSFYAEDGLAGRTDTGSLFETHHGELCFLEQSVVSRFDGRRFVPTRLQWPRDIWYFGWGTGQLALQDRTGDWWIATGQGLARFPPVSFDRLGGERPKAVYRVADGLLHDEIFQLFEDSRGDIWVGAGGVAVAERRTGRIHAFSEADGVPPPFIPTGFAEDRAGNVWVGTYHAGLARYRNGRFRVFTDSKGEPGGSWKVPYIDSAGRLWVASEQGLGRADNPTETAPSVVTYTTAQGLSSNDVKAVTEDLMGNIYVATGRGVDRIRATPQGIVVTRHYTNADGLAAGELASAYRDRSGNLWFVTTLGISRLTPAPDRSPVLPPVLVTGLQIGAAAHPVAEAGQAEVQGLRIQPGQGPLRIDFVGLSFAPGETLRYQYQLAGVDLEWSAPTDQRTVMYGRLAAGTYRFLARAVNSEGMTSLKPATVAFTVLPPIWLRWWFVLAASLAAAAVVYAAHRYRVRQILAVERVRTRIATDLHDDIGSSLSQIAILSEVARRESEDGTPRVARPLSEIAAVSGELVDSMSDIVWAINPKHDHLSNLEHRMRRFATDVLTARGIGLEFRATATRPDLRIGADIRRQVFLIFKEAVNNIARHSGASLATVEFSVAQEHLVLQVTDNGTGFDPADEGDGNGLINIRKRASDLGGTPSIESLPNCGTTLTLRVPLTYQCWWGRKSRK